MNSNSSNFSEVTASDLNSFNAETRREPSGLQQFIEDAAIDANLINTINSRDSINDDMQSIDSLVANGHYAHSDINSDGKDDVKDELNNNSELTLEKTRLFSPKLSQQRRNILKHFCIINLFIACYCCTIYVYFWGTTYNTDKYYNKVKILALVQDDSIDDSMKNITSVNEIFPVLFGEMLGTWHIFNNMNFTTHFGLNGRNSTAALNEKVIKLIYDEDYWLAINVKPDVTQNMIDSLISSDAHPFNSTDFFQVVYESGRDPSHVEGFMLPIMQDLEYSFQQYCIKDYLPKLAQNLTNSNYQIKFSNLALMGNISFDYLDYRPFYDRIILISSQVGDVFALLLTIFQFLTFSQLHGRVAPLLKARSRIYYRIIISGVTHFLASLFWCTVSAIYQVDFTKTFGRGGFMIYWMSTWLYMWAAGSANENVISLIFAVVPQWLGFWILGFVLLNMAPTFFPMVFDNNFYRIGYIFPMRNIVDIHRIIFLDLSKKKMGRCYGILASWIVLNITLLPFNMKLAKKLTIWKEKRNKK